MPIVLREIFDVREEVYFNFIHRYHGRIVDLLNQFHDGIGVVGPSRLTDQTRWSTITLTNNIGRSIEIVTSLESLWVYGYRQLSDENNILPWRLVSGYTREGNFSSLPGQHESLGFDGKYTSSTSTQNVSRPSLNSAVTVLDNYAHTPANSDKANDCFLVIVLYFAEALRILPIRDLLCNNFSQYEPVKVGIFNMSLARSWHTLSSAFLQGSYSRVASYNRIHNADDVKETLWLVYNKSTKLHDLDGVRDSRPGDPGNGDETGPRDSGMGGYSGDGGPKRSGGQGGSKNEGGQPRDRFASSRSRRPRVGSGRSGNLVHLPLSHDLVGVIQLLSTCASGSPLAAKTLLLLGISGTLSRPPEQISGLSRTILVKHLWDVARKNGAQIFEIVNLANELLPSLPQGTISLPVSYSFLVGGISRKSPVASSSKQDESRVTNDTSAREKLLEEQLELLKQFGMDLLPILTQVYGSSINGPICHKCLSVIAKLVYYSSADMIQTLLGTTNISSLLAGILAWKDPQVLIPALQIAETLMEKLPGIFSKMFVKGVIHAIESLICQESSSATPNQVPATDNDSDALTGTSSHSGQYSRRVSGPSMDSTNLDEVKIPPPATDTPGSSSSLRVVVSGRAKSYKEKYFPCDSDSSDVGVTDVLRLLRTLCTKLNACAENKGKGKLKVSAVGSFDISAGVEEQLNEVVAEMLIELSKGDGVSTFEFIGSGAVIALLNYLSCGTFGKEKIPDNTYHKLRQQALRRYKSFISIALRFDKDGSGTPMMTLVQKLQNALSSLEQFPVVLSHSGRSSSSGGARLSSGLSALSQPFKLRLYRAQGEKSLRDYSSNVVLIDPLASLAAVEDFLWPRIQCTGSSSTQKSSTNSESGSANAAPAATASSGSGPVARCSTRYTRSSVKIGGGTSGKDSQEASGSANTCSSKGKGKGKAVLKRSSEEPKGLQTIKAARRKAASEKDTEMTSAHDNSSSEELDLHDILSFDTEFGKILQELQILVHRKKYLESSGDSTQAIDDLRFRGAPIEDLCLDFTLPGYPGYVLKEGQESTSVNIDNLEEYISLVVDATVKMGIARQMEAFRNGFNQVFDVTSLQIFSPNELDYLICGHRELWEAETLVDHIKFDDGYTAKSPVIVNLLEIMAEFSPEQQHAFCQFVTGAPQLPPGGLAALSPKLTIVRKHPSNVTSTPTRTGATESADEDLPTVMTCANYVKLPPYSTKEVMHKKLLYAINEGQGSFDLS